MEELFQGRPVASLGEKDEQRFVVRQGLIWLDYFGWIEMCMIERGHRET
jgi:hypothetical protein